MGAMKLEAIGSYDPGFARVMMEPTTWLRGTRHEVPVLNLPKVNLVGSPPAHSLPTGIYGRWYELPLYRHS